MVCFPLGESLNLANDKALIIAFSVLIGSNFSSKKRSRENANEVHRIVGTLMVGEGDMMINGA